jgi:hypothetical protein
MEIAATERLRPLQANDLRAFVAYRSHPDVARYQSWEPTYAMDDAEALLAAQADVAFGTPASRPPTKLSYTVSSRACATSARSSPSCAPLMPPFQPDGRGDLRSATVGLLIRYGNDRPKRRRIGKRVQARKATQTS